MLLQGMVGGWAVIEASHTVSSGLNVTCHMLMASKHICYKLVTSLSTRARNMNALDMCHTRNQLERVFPL